MDYQEVLEQLVNGEKDEFKVEPKNAFEFQKALRNFGKRQNITGRAQRGGAIIYTGVKADK